MTYDFKLECALPAPPEAVYHAWLDSAAHTAMTGGAAKIAGRVGGRFTAWDGYISGKTLALTPGARIVQSWRTSEFAAADPDFDPHRRTRADEDGHAADAFPPGRARPSHEL